ncbi:hypothetical protein KFK09_009358 [Dendrobium nobile]|uniref:Uncharacterized protein n=1 Tax=Dendrobium nobile TaxID=94219 RepID=A0A8T3BN61_DENNO|nr:hypothetical protein KFK09_009358 [Dendrobium nobile]
MPLEPKNTQETQNFNNNQDNPNIPSLYLSCGPHLNENNSLPPVVYKRTVLISGWLDRCMNAPLSKIHLVLKVKREKK